MQLTKLSMINSQQWWMGPGCLNRKLHMKNISFKDSLNVNDIHSSKATRVTLLMLTLKKRPSCLVASMLYNRVIGFCVATKWVVSWAYRYFVIYNQLFKPIYTLA